MTISIPPLVRGTAENSLLGVIQTWAAVTMSACIAIAINGDVSYTPVLGNWSYGERMRRESDGAPERHGSPNACMVKVSGYRRDKQW